MDGNLSSKELSHHGIVATVCDEIGLVKLIDTIIPPDPRAEITIGESVKLMIINGLGFTSRPLYLQAQFFDSKPIKRLLGREIASENISDDRLGRCLDRCYDAGCDRIFSEVASRAALHFEISKKFRHLDSTSISVTGEYSTDSDECLELVSHGHSKDHRPDLKQFMISLVCSQDGDIPLLAQTIPGNTSDQTHFKEVLTELKSQIIEGEKCYYVADSAIYTSKTLPEISDKIKWIGRAPEKIKEVKVVVQNAEVAEMQASSNGYKYIEKQSNYSGVEQRWLVVYSKHAYERESKTLDRRINKEFAKANKDAKKIGSRRFNCESDARAAMEHFSKKLKYHKIKNMEIIEKLTKNGRGRPKKDDPKHYVYTIQAEFEQNDDIISKERNKKGKFVIATNELNHESLSNEELLFNYKNGQQSVERGFKFLKNPSFMCASTYLKKQERIVALGMIMCLCLLVYTLSQRLLQTKLVEHSETLPDQRGKQIATPSMRWIFQIFEGVHVLFQRVDGVLKELVLNMNSVREKVLHILGPPFEKIYQNAL